MYIEVPDLYHNSYDSITRRKSGYHSSPPNHSVTPFHSSAYPSEQSNSLLVEMNHAFNYINISELSMTVQLCKHQWVRHSSSIREASISKSSVTVQSHWSLHGPECALIKPQADVCSARSRPPWLHISHHLPPWQRFITAFPNDPVHHV